MTLGKLIGRGRTADIYLWGEDKVIKLFHENFSEKSIDFEFHINKIVQDIYPNIPKVFEKTRIQNKTGIIFEYIQGPTLLEVFTRNPFSIFKEVKRFVELHVEMHKCGVAGLNDLKNYLLNDIKRVKELDDNQRNLIIKVLDNLPSKNILCHRDFHPDNILYAEKSLVVIDWITSVQGAPAADVARSYYIMKYGSPMQIISRIDKLKIKIFRSVASRLYLYHYCKKAKMKRKEIKKWELVTIVARLREGITEEKDFILKRINELIKKASKKKT